MTYRPEKKHFGFWFNVRNSTVASLIGFEGVFGLVFAATATIGAHRFLDVKERVSIANDFLSTTTGLLGVVFAAFALVGALMSDGYTRILQRTKGRVNSFFSPFIIVIGAAVGTILSTICYKAIAEHVPASFELPLFWTSVFLFLYTLLNVVALSRNIFAHGVTRAIVLEIEDRPPDGRQ
jgi:MFS family permease